MEQEQALDLEAVEAVLRGDGAAFGRIVGRYQRMVAAIVWRHGFRREDVEDIVSEVFVKAYRNLHRYRPEHPFATWLYRLARNHTIDRTRRARTDLARGEMPEQPRDPAPGPAAIVEKRERAGLVRRALGDVPPVYREAVELVYVEGRRVEEAARLLEVPEGTVKTRLMRGREALRRILRDRHPELFGDADGL